MKRLDALMLQHYLVSFIEYLCMRREYAEAIEAFKLWRDPPFCILDTLATYHVQLGNTEEARTAFDLYLRTRPSNYDNAIGAAAHLKILKPRFLSVGWNRAIQRMLWYVPVVPVAIVPII